MKCKLKRRLDVPLRKGEKCWSCDNCGALIFGKERPKCRAEVLAEVQARHASAQAEAHILNLDNKVKPK